VWPTVGLLTGALGSCGGTATSHPQRGAAGSDTANAGKDGASDAGRTGAGTSGAAVGGQVGNTAGAGGVNAAGGGGVNAAGAGGANTGEAGAAGDGSLAGAGGAGACVDVCQRYGEACCVPMSCVGEDASCVVDVFDQQISIKYEYADLEAAVAALPETFLASISTADITSSAAEPFPASRLELALSAASSSLYGTALEGAMMHPFRVSCAGQRLYVGLVYLLEGAAALDIPVLHVSRDAEDAIVMRLGAWQGAWGFPSTGNIASRARLDPPALRSTLCLNGAPKEL